MSYSLHEGILSRLSDFIDHHLALHFPQKRWYDLERNITKASKEFGYSDVSSFIERIISTPLSREHAEILASHLTINETYFWREPASFKALEEIIIPEIVEKRKNQDKRIRIWSAGCSGGEEPYSIAIALHKTIPDIENWNISILATDINPNILKKARAGIYRPWSFRGEPDWLKKHYFINRHNEQFEVIPEIKKMVRFEYLNLAEDNYPSSINYTNAMDIVFCRNVMMYFTQDRFKRVVKGLYNALLQEGYLIVSASELSVQNFQDFSPVKVFGTVLYQKTANKVLKKSPKTTIHTFVSPPQMNLPKAAPKIVQKEIKVEKPIVRKIEEPLKNEIPVLQNSKISADESIKRIKELANLGKLNEAIESCKDAVKQHKLDPRIYYLYSTILQESDQVTEAIAELKRAIYIDAEFVLPYFTLGNIYRKQNKTKEAKKCFENAFNILNKCEQDEIVFESEGLTAGRFKEIITATLKTSA